jgi:multiple sugar transport system ATP-binding protein
VAPIRLEEVTKIYPNGVEAVHELDLEVADGEFLVVVGPSGCGKTTALRMVAGLETITSGRLWIGDRCVNEVSSRERDVAMVFQNYALYPHMTAGENIGFALRLRHLPKKEIQAKVRAAADILGLSEWLNRKPGELSGGQRQRVAMGRAIVREPSIFLMDEPLSNLDAKLRVQMRAEVLRIQRRIGVATMYVTHDQTEAMTMGDRVAVMRHGVLQQCDRPQMLYDRPQNLFVGAFIGSPAMNLYEVTLDEGARGIRIGNQDLPLSDASRSLRPALARYSGKKVVVGIRAEDLPAANGSSGAALEGRVELVEALGAEQLIHFSVDSAHIYAEQEDIEEQEALALTASSELTATGEGVARVDREVTMSVGEQVRFAVDPKRFHFFDLATGDAIWS